MTIYHRISSIAIAEAPAVLAADEFTAVAAVVAVATDRSSAAVAADRELNYELIDPDRRFSSVLCCQQSKKNRSSGPLKKRVNVRALLALFLFVHGQACGIRR